MATKGMLRLGPPPAPRREGFYAQRIADDDVAQDPVLSRWARVQALGVRWQGRAEPEVVATSELAERRERLDALLARPSELTESIVEELGERRVMAVLADRDGVIVRARLGRFAQRAAQVRLLEGARWAEGARGTNAIGTALVERRSVAVIGSAHYERANHGLFCYATPILDPYGELAGAFDVTGDLEADDPTLAAAVRAVGASLEQVLRLSAYASAIPGGARLLERMLARCASPALLVEAPGVVRRANASAASAFALGGADARVDEVFGVDWGTLSREALSGDGRARYESRGVEYALSFEPVAGASGRLLAVVVYFDRVPRTPPPPSPERPHAAFDGIAGSDAAIVRAKAIASRFAPTTVPVLLLAETGTGKELFARAIHAASKRADGPFVPINCGALSASLLESELFGYAPGAFTGARQGGSEGKIAAAFGGTLFLDEIGEMSPALQAMLLRVLEDGTYSRIGESRARHADFRLVCATCRELPAMVASGAFRSDLFYRIQGAILTLPPVRERSDRLELAEAVLDAAAREMGVRPPRLSATARAYVETQPWPGNVRELKSALRYALVLASGGELHAEHFPPPFGAVVARASEPPVMTRDEALVRAVEAALRTTGGNVSEAARKLGVSRGVIYRMRGARRS